MSALFDFNAFVVAGLLAICACTYVREYYPSLLNSRHGCVLSSIILKKVVKFGSFSCGILHIANAQCLTQSNSVRSDSRVQRSRQNIVHNRESSVACYDEIQDLMWWLPFGLVCRFSWFHRMELAYHMPMHCVKELTARATWMYCSREFGSTNGKNDPVPLVYTVSDLFNVASVKTCNEFEG